MALDITNGQVVRVTITQNITRAAAKMTVERLFMKDKAIVKALTLRSRNFKAIPKRRGGRIWTKYPNKIHPNLDRGASATITLTPQFMRDLASIEKFVSVEATA